MHVKRTRRRRDVSALLGEHALEDLVRRCARQLARHADVIRTVSRPDGGDFFARNGILFRSLDEVRRDANERLKKLLKEHKISEDDERKGLEHVQKMTDEHVKLIDDLQKKKDQDLLVH